MVTRSVRGNDGNALKTAFNEQDGILETLVAHLHVRFQVHIENDRSVLNARNKRAAT